MTNIEPEDRVDQEARGEVIAAQIVADALEREYRTRIEAAEEWMRQGSE